MCAMQFPPGTLTLSRMEAPQPERAAALAAAAIAEGVLGYRQIVARCVEDLGRPLLKPEKTAITAAIHGRHDAEAAAAQPAGAGDEAAAPAAALPAQSPEPEPEPEPRVLLFTAFSLDYAVGHLCAAANKAFAAKHGYGWRCRALPLEEMAAALDGGPPTWYKVLMLNQLLAEQQATKEPPYTHIMWVDADAVVIDHTKKVEQLIALGNYREMSEFPIETSRIHPWLVQFSTASSEIFAAAQVVAART